MDELRSNRFEEVGILQVRHGRRCWGYFIGSDDRRSVIPRFEHHLALMGVVLENAAGDNGVADRLNDLGACRCRIRKALISTRTESELVHA